MTTRFPADVAELADAQVSEACDGDIVEVQVLSSAPRESKRRVGRKTRLAVFALAIGPIGPIGLIPCQNPPKKFVTDFRIPVSSQ